MRITQGAFSFLPDLTDEEIRMQLAYCLGRGWAVSLEHTDDPHPRNTYWEMWGRPMFDLEDAAAVMDSLAECRRACPGCYIRITAFDSSRGVESVALSFIVDRPAEESGFRLVRAEGPSRAIRYAIESRAVAAASPASGPDE